MIETRIERIEIPKEIKQGPRAGSIAETPAEQAGFLTHCPTKPTSRTITLDLAHISSG
jgi:hypothetical protein